MGDLEPGRLTGGTGAAAALGGLGLVEPRASRWRAGVASALVGLAVLGGISTQAKADTLPLAAPTAITQTLPQTTGPPGASVLGARQSVLATRIAQATSAAQLPTMSPAGPAAQATLPDLPDLPGASGVDAARGTAVSDVSRAAVERFQAQVEQIVRLDAAGLASSRAPLGAGSALSDGQQQQLRDALKDLVRELPVGSLSDSLQDSLARSMRAHGVSTADLETRPLKDLGPIAGDIVKAIVHEFRAERPAAYRALAVASATALGAGAILEGSRVLEVAGVKPELKLAFLKDSVQARAGATWEARLKNPTAYAGVTTTFPVQVQGAMLTGELGARVEARGPTFGQLQASGFALSGSLQGKLKDGAAVSTSLTAAFAGDGKMTSTTLSGTWTRDKVSVTGSGTYAADPGRFIGSLSVGYRPARDIDIHLTGTHDSRGDASIGVGVRWRF